MTNLIPKEAKRMVRIEYTVRLISVFLFAASVLFLILAVVFASTQVLVKLRIQGVKTTATDATEYAQAIEFAVSEIEAANTKTKYLVKGEVEEKLLTYLTELEAIASDAVSIQTYAIERNEDVAVDTIEITAIADTRQKLITFLDTVQTHASFGEVEVPIGDLASARDISFSVTVPVLSDES